MKYTITERTKEGLRKTSASKQQILEQKKCKEILTSYFISLESEAFTKLAVTNSESHSYITTTFAGVGVGLPCLVRQGFCTPGHRECGLTFGNYSHSNNQEHEKVG